MVLILYPWDNEYDGEFANHCDENCANASWADRFTHVNENKDDGHAITSPVGSRPDGAAWVGTMDMSGNLSEWTLSEYIDYPYDAHDGRNDNLENTDVLRVLRGGSLGSLSFLLLSANRSWTNPTDDFITYGFRCAHSYEQ